MTTGTVQRKKKVGWMAGLCAGLLFASNWGVFGTTAHAATNSTEVLVHYHRFDNSYATWNLWMWPYQPVSGDGAGYDFNAPADDFGAVADAQIPGDNTQVGFLIRKGNWEGRDISDDRHIDLSRGHEIWVVQGDPGVYYSLQDAQQAATPGVSSAFLDSENTVRAQLNVPTTLGNGASGFTVTDTTTGQQIPVTAVNNAKTYTAVLVGDLQQALGAKGNWSPNDFATQFKQVNTNLYQFSGTLPAGTYQYKVAMNGTWDAAYPSNNVSLTVPTGGANVTFSYVPSTNAVYDSINNPAPDLPTSSAGAQTNLVDVQLASAPDVTHTLQLVATGYKANTIMPRNVLNQSQYFYGGNDLGNVYNPSGTAFRVWAPTASDVQVQLFNSETGAQTQQVPLSKSEHGTWAANVPGNLKNWYYLYQVNVGGVTQTAVDPYATALAVNATRAMIVDPHDVDPAGWNGDKHQTPANPEDAVIYETHVRDFSIDANSGLDHKGQFLAFTEHGTKGPAGVKTGLDSLKELGVTDVQIMPSFEFNSIDETKTGQYNWGYDPRNYNVPEGGYATTPHGTARITEFKQMVNSLHKNHIGVIMDVVYNHTFAAKISDFDKIVPEYYYRTDDNGNYTNGSGCGNEIAAERPMVRKFVTDSVKYWVNEYHVDGFRFDLMALLGTDTMKVVSDELHAINPGILIYGEPWTGGTSGLPSDQLLSKGQQKGLGVAVFNDNIRNGLDGNVFDKQAKGFATGSGSGDDLNAIKNGVVGSINDFTASPSETINYVTSHDNMTLWDKIAVSNASDSEADRIKMDELAQAVVLTSQGIPFMQGGEEMLRTKGGNDNSYSAGDEVNQFDWSRKAQYKDVFNYYAGLIDLRTSHPAFRMTTAEQINQHLQYLNAPANSVAFELTDHANRDTWKKIVVVYNSGKDSQTVTLPSGKWKIVGTQGRVGHETLGEATGTVTVPGIACEVLYQQ
jgi:pullulanase